MTRTTQPAAATPKPAKAAAANSPEDKDPLYIKAKNEIDGYTLVPLNKIDNNPTVERVGDKVYGNKDTGEMVIAKRKAEVEGEDE
jgi:hypothetical protein